MHPLRILTAGPLSWEMGLEYALCAVAQLHARGVDVRYDIVGSGPERDRVVYTAFDLGVEDIVTVHPPGTVVHADVVLWTHLRGETVPPTRARVVGPGIDPRDPLAIAEALS